MFSVYINILYTSELMILSVSFKAFLSTEDNARACTSTSEAEDWLNQQTPVMAGISVATLGKSFTCVGSSLLSLSSLIGG